jgi:hypothetical protein
VRTKERETVVEEETKVTMSTSMLKESEKGTLYAVG